MKKILMIGTGGTIASKQTENGLAPGLTPEDILAYIPRVKEVCEVETMQVCNIDSTNVSPAHWQMMAQAVRDHYEKYDGFVICHGTDTLAYTAAALSYMIQNSEKREKMEKRNLKIIKNYGQETVLQKLDKFFDEIVGGVC